jgi:hypothetical protein
VNVELEALAFFEAHVIVFEHVADAWQKTSEAYMSVFDVERATEFSAVENIPAFHNSDFHIRDYEAVRDQWCISYSKRVANPVSTSNHIYSMFAVALHRTVFRFWLH